MAILNNGYYRFVDIINFQAQVIGATFDFVCDGVTYPSISFDDNNEILEYGATTVYTISDGWLDEKYKKIYVPTSVDISAMVVTLITINSTYNFTISYNSNGGESVNPRVQVEVIDYLPSITKQGYIFDGWYLEPTFVTLAVLNQPISDDITLYAKWNETYNIYFNSDGGTPCETIRNVITIPSLPTTTKESFNFLGWFYETSFETQAQVGDTLTSDITLFAKWEFIGGLYLDLYNCICENNRVDKNDYLSNKTKMNILMIQPSSITNPILDIEYNGDFNFNYCYIPKFNRWYFINDIVSIRTNLWRISLKCDVLMSFKNQILGNKGIIARQEFNNNPYLVDEKIPTNANNIIEVVDIDTDIDIKSETSYGDVYLLELGSTSYE